MATSSDLSVPVTPLQDLHEQASELAGRVRKSTADLVRLGRVLAAIAAAREHRKAGHKALLAYADKQLKINQATALLCLELRGLDPDVLEGLVISQEKLRVLAKVTPCVRDPLIQVAAQVRLQALQSAVTSGLYFLLKYEDEDAAGEHAVEVARGLVKPLRKGRTELSVGQLGRNLGNALHRDRLQLLDLLSRDPAGAWKQRVRAELQLSLDAVDGPGERRHTERAAPPDATAGAPEPPEPPEPVDLVVEEPPPPSGVGLHQENVNDSVVVTQQVPTPEPGPEEPPPPEPEESPPPEPERVAPPPPPEPFPRVFARGLRAALEGEDLGRLEEQLFLVLHGERVAPQELEGLYLLLTMQRGGAGFPREEFDGWLAAMGHKDFTVRFEAAWSVFEEGGFADLPLRLLMLRGRPLPEPLMARVLARSLENPLYPAGEEPGAEESDRAVQQLRVAVELTDEPMARFKGGEPIDDRTQRMTSYEAIDLEMDLWRFLESLGVPRPARKKNPIFSPYGW